MNFDMDLDSNSGKFKSGLALHDNSGTTLNSAVWSVIEEWKAKDSGAFSDNDWLSLRDLPILLQITLKALQNRQMNIEDCSSYLAQHLSLRTKLLQAYARKEFDRLLSDCSWRVQYYFHSIASIRQLTSMNSSSSDSNLKAAFEKPYQGEAATLFILTLHQLRRSYAGQPAADQPYNWSLAVIQSSGMGKSRMIDQSSLSVFTLPINIREEPPEGKKAYPPSDKGVCQFFDDCQKMDDARQQIVYAIFLRVLFTKTLDLVNTEFQRLNGHRLAEAWALYLKSGETEDQVGENRREFYSSVVNEVNKALLNSIQPTLVDLEISLTESCSLLELRVQATTSNAANSFFVYFDEAHSLTTVPKYSPEHKRSGFHNLGTVLSKLIDNRSFFIFLSTNSRLEGFAPPGSNYPSYRVTENSRLIPPFTELPFDLYERKVLKGRTLTLKNVCQTEVMVGFGRVLWHAELEIRPHKNIFQFAINKLTAVGKPDETRDASLAALGVRVGITFDKTNHASHPLESRLVESHLRVVYAIPEHRHFMHTGSPSEPILAEAAGRYLNRPGTLGFAIEGPTWLSPDVKKGLLVRGERGELAGRLLVTCAHDKALEKKVDLTSLEPQYHRPIPVLDFLGALFHKDHYESILKAMPIIDRVVPGQPNAAPLDKAFSASYVSFSHFVLAEDSKMLSAPALATGLVRGMAIQARDGQASIDAVIPIHMGSLTDPISSKTTSAINLQFKNRVNAVDCHVNRLITVPNVEMPVISIIFEFGVTETAVDPISITSELFPTTQAQTLHRDDRHYQIVAHGCNSRVFGAIPLEVEPEYKTILGTGSILQDFPRNKDQGNREALLALKPAFNGNRQIQFYSDLLEEE
ncbi:unnamed protein product [Rhizoctonia solani]|uniref:G2/mitotic-specific cyclin cdc13 n=1 Tax=Rhizoctonia solani TaxID=456999 RepID=A0A8H3AZZ4_9AGAM|nr:unnamed protein product [Rhizoctonia solani]CAE6444556.1 unnamed protein product [Rhizoctonia solani]